MAFWPTFWRELRHTIDYLLPPACLACGALLSPEDPESTAWCPDCSLQFQQQVSAFCPRCATPYQTRSMTQHTCEDCLRNPPPFSRTHAVGCYSGRLKETIQQFKYRGQLVLERPLARLISTHLSGSMGDFSPNLIIPVPLHIARLRQRGFNQAHQLAKRVGRELQVRTESSLLKRHRETRSQSELKAAERQSNLHDAFCLTGSVAGQRILLIDDVMTTGATARACSSALLAGGASEVQVAVLGRA